MRRRGFITFVVGVVIGFPFFAFGQQPTVPKVGFVYPGPKGAVPPRIEAIISGLRVGGYSSPSQVELVIRMADGDPAQIRPLTEEIIAKNVDVFVANGPAVLDAARRATQTTPIVALDLETDPVASGIAATLARPQGNVTGVFLDFPDFTTKWIELLRESNPKLSRIAVLWDPTTGAVQLESIKRAAGLFKIELDILEVRSASNFEDAFSAARQRSADAIVLLSSPLISANVQVLAELAIRHRLSAITLFPDFARAGGLLAYGPNLLALYRRTGVLAGKVLGGVKAGELPIERPTKFELVLNLKTATTLSLAVSPSLLLRADEVID